MGSSQFFEFSSRRHAPTLARAVGVAVRSPDRAAAHNRRFQPTSLPPGLRPYGRAAAEAGR